MLSRLPASLGACGRIVDLYKLIQGKDDTTISIVLGLNIDVIVIDEEKITFHFPALSIPHKPTVPNQIFFVFAQPACMSNHVHSIQVEPINEQFRSFTKGARMLYDTK
ncbi:hypothetical protein BYT27DRAFT_7252187 [Phlegmacium glaucopus]|nr:hypothetical protein BYT27DRAFT_7252187 [Phlegmacium glaucopus]